MKRKNTNSGIGKRGWLAALIGAALLATAATGQQSLTTEQIEILNSLPEGQRQELLERYLRGERTSSDQALEFPQVVVPRRDETEDDAKLRIDGGETLVIEFALPGDISSADRRDFLSDPNRAALLGSNTYEVDSNGVLRLQGVANIPLAGLNTAEIEVRLGAEPGLQDLGIKATLLPLAQSGVASLERFGSRLFDGAPSTFAPATDVPVPADYVVGPGDTIKLQLFGNENVEHRLVIGRDGNLNVPDIGPLGTTGLTFSELREELVSRIDKQKIGVQASVTMGEIRSIRVFVLGDVRTPGSFTVSGLSTMTNALFVSGGITEAGSMRNVQLKRNGRTVVALDLYDLLLRGDTSDDRRLQPGDVIFIPAVGDTVAVSGEVVRPAVYEISSERSVDAVIEMAGGLLPTAYRAAARIERIDDSGRRTILDLDLGRDRGAGQAVRNGDHIYVDVVLDELEDSVVLGGHVRRPGPFAWRPGLRLADVIAAPEALKTQADLGYVLVRRERAATGEVEVLSGDLRQAWRDPRSSGNIELEARDTITVFELGPSRGAAVRAVIEELGAQAQFGAPFQAVSIAGQVRAAGTYPLESDMRLSDLIRAGGGMRESAYATHAEITRYFIGESGQRRARLIPVDLERALRGDPEHDVLLSAYDHLSVREIPEWRDNETIQIRGEVRFPGIYTIQRNETLRSVLQRAGGITEHGNPRGAVFTRASLQEREREQIRVLADRLENDLATFALQSSRQDGDTAQAISAGQSLLAQLRNTEPVGRLVIDLETQAIGGGPGASDLLLRAGDMLMVPEEAQEVTVIGEVQYPTSHVYDPLLSRDDYIERSGGTSSRADEQRIYIVRVDGSVVVDNQSRFFRRGGGARVEAGDTIVVPIDAESLPPLELWSNVTQIIFNLAVAVSAVNSF